LSWENVFSSRIILTYARGPMTYHWPGAQSATAQVAAR